MTKVQINITTKIYADNVTLRGAYDSIKALYVTIKVGKSTQLIVERVVNVRDFIEGVIEDIHGKQENIDSIDINDENSAVDPVMRQYLQDKYPYIKFK